MSLAQQLSALYLQNFVQGLNAVVMAALYNRAFDLGYVFGPPPQFGSAQEVLINEDELLPPLRAVFEDVYNRVDAQYIERAFLFLGISFTPPQ